MEAMMSRMSQNGTTLYDDVSYRLKQRPLSQSSNPGHLAQAPGGGQGFDDMGSSFGTNKPKRVQARVCADSDDEMDMLSSALSSDDTKVAHKHKAKSASKGKGKAMANDEQDGVIIDGKLLPYHKDYKPKKFPKINKIKRTSSTDDTQSQPTPKSTSRPRPKAAYIGTSSNPIPVASEPKSKVSSPASSRTTPLHDRSPNRPSKAATARPKARPAYRGAKKQDPKPFAGSSPTHTTVLGSPVKAKGKGKEFPMDMSLLSDRRVEKSSSFPQLPPLYSAATTKPKQQPFPNVPPLSYPVKAKATGSDSENGENENDELGMNSDDEILTRGGPRPFPMSTQVLHSLQQNGKRLSGGIGRGGTRENKRRDDGDDGDGDDDDVYALIHMSRHVLIVALQFYGSVKLRRYFAIRRFM
jgi:hypothetical protein